QSAGSTNVSECRAIESCFKRSKRLISSPKARYTVKRRFACAVHDNLNRDLPYQSARLASNAHESAGSKLISPNSGVFGIVTSTAVTVSGTLGVEGTAIDRITRTA